MIHIIIRLTHLFRGFQCVGSNCQLRVKFSLTGIDIIVTQGRLFISWVFLIVIYKCFKRFKTFGLLDKAYSSKNKRFVLTVIERRVTIQQDMGKVNIWNIAEGGIRVKIINGT